MTASKRPPGRGNLHQFFCLNVSNVQLLLIRLGIEH